VVSEADTDFYDFLLRDKSFDTTSFFFRSSYPSSRTFVWELLAHWLVFAGKCYEFCETETSSLFLL